MMLEILLVEDYPADVVLTSKALQQSNANLVINVVEDGEDALKFLRGEPPYTNAKPPALVLLDLNLPRMDGKEVLRQLKDDPSLNHIPVIVLTTSSNRKDIGEAYRLQANCVLNKPVTFKELQSLVFDIKRFWLDTAQIINS